MKDITMVTLAIRHAHDQLSLGWRVIFMLLGGLRRRLFLPALVGVIPTLVVLKGGDALSVVRHHAFSLPFLVYPRPFLCLREDRCMQGFNTIAVLFLCDIDNIAFDHGLNDGARLRVESLGRVKVEGDEKQLLVRIKIVHAALITYGR